MGLWVKETHVDLDKGVQYYQGQWYEAQGETTGELFRGLKKEFGRVTGRVYREREGGGDIQVGWVFWKRMEYEDRPGTTYCREVWVEVSLVEPVRKSIWTQFPVSPWKRGKGE